MNFIAGKGFFMDTHLNILELSDSMVHRHLRTSRAKINTLKRSVRRKHNPCATRRAIKMGLEYCLPYNRMLKHWKIYSNASETIGRRLTAYGYLRNEGMLAKDVRFLESMAQKAIKERSTNAKLLKGILMELVYEQEDSLVSTYLQQYLKNKLIDENLENFWRNQLKLNKLLLEAELEGYQIK